jgi:hypothetical protein
MHIVSEQGSERATNDKGKIITYDGRTHVTWQDVTREGYFNRVRTLDHATGKWSAPVTLDTGVDNHARAVLAITPDGILHAVLGVACAAADRLWYVPCVPERSRRHPLHDGAWPG